MRYPQKLCEYAKKMELQKPQDAIIQIVNLCTGTQNCKKSSFEV